MAFREPYTVLLGSENSYDKWTGGHTNGRDEQLEIQIIVSVSDRINRIWIQTLRKNGSPFRVRILRFCQTQSGCCFIFGF